MSRRLDARQWQARPFTWFAHPSACWPSSLTRSPCAAARLQGVATWGVSETRRRRVSRCASRALVQTACCLSTSEPDRSAGHGRARGCRLPGAAECVPAVVLRPTGWRAHRPLTFGRGTLCVDVLNFAFATVTPACQARRSWKRSALWPQSGPRWRRSKRSWRPPTGVQFPGQRRWLLLLRSARTSAAARPPRVPRVVAMRLHPGLDACPS